MGIRSVIFSISVWLLHIIAPQTVRVTNHFSFPGTILWASLVGRKNPWLRIHLQCQRPRVDSWVRKVPWRRDRQPIPMYSWASLAPQIVKNPSAMWETWVGNLGWEDPLEEGMASHSSILAWRISWFLAQKVIHIWTQKVSFFGDRSGGLAWKYKSQTRTKRNESNIAFSIKWIQQVSFDFYSPCC